MYPFLYPSVKHSRNSKNVLISILIRVENQEISDNEIAVVVEVF
jgi:hypothetical protein